MGRLAFHMALAACLIACAEPDHDAAVADDGGGTGAAPSGGGFGEPSGGAGASAGSSAGGTIGGAGAGGAPSGGGTGAAGASDAGASDAAAESDCCVAHAAPGCKSPAVQTCVCAKDAFCCSTAWDEGCVSEVGTLSCGTCGAEGGVGGGGGSGAKDGGGAGGGGGVGGTGTSGGAGGVGGGGDCCLSHATPGCNLPTVESCVCNYEPNCCLGSWTLLCVMSVGVYGCGIC